MLFSPTSSSYAALVARLRAAGCVFAEEEADVLLRTARTPPELESMVARRTAGVPLEHVVGWVDFCGLRLQIDPGVFVPRRRTELLVRTAARRTAPGAVVLDLCCGTGAVGLALRALVGDVELHACDLDAAAVSCARRNLAGAGHVHHGDLYAPVPRELRGRVATLTANVPYVPSAAIATLPAEARDHEPRTALDGGADGLHLLRRVAAGAGDWLRPGGHLVVETSEHQAAAAAGLFTAAGLTARTVHSPQEETTVVIGTRPAPAP